MTRLEGWRSGNFLENEFTRLLLTLEIARRDGLRESLIMATRKTDARVIAGSRRLGY